MFGFENSWANKSAAIGYEPAALKPAASAHRRRLENSD